MDEQNSGVTFGLMVPWLIGVEEGLRLTRLAEELGFHSVWAGDHLLWYVPFPDPIAVLSASAAVTSRIKLGTGVMLAALRPPVLLAKQLASLDWVSQGRLIAGFGIGGENPAEFTAAGVPIEERSRRLDESVEVCRQLWSGEPVSYRGRHLRVESPALDLVPTQGQPPIWIGGRRELSLRRAGRLGDGWLGFVVTPDRFAESLARVEEHALEADRDPGRLGRGLLIWTQLGSDPLSARNQMAPLMEAFYRTPFARFERFCIFGDPAAYATRLQEYIDAGARHFNLSFSMGDRAAQMRTFQEEVVPRLRLPVPESVQDAGELRVP